MVDLVFLCSVGAPQRCNEAREEEKLSLQLSKKPDKVAESSLLSPPLSVFEYAL